MKKALWLVTILVYTIMVTACSTKHITRTQHDERQYQGSSTTVHVATDTTDSTATETTMLVIEFDTGSTATVPPGWLESIVASVQDADTTGDQAAASVTTTQPVVLEGVKSIKAIHTKHTSEKAVTQQADIAQADTMAATVTESDSTDTRRGAVAITEKRNNGFSFWFALVLAIVLFSVGMYFGFRIEKQP